MTANLAAGCDQAMALARPHRVTGGPRMVLAATVLASSLAFLDGAVVNIALPAIGLDLGAEEAALSRIVTGYLLPLGTLQLLAGALGDHYGRRRMLVAGIVVFTIASCLCAVAPGAALLMAARIVQGVGAALVLPNSLAVLGSAFRDGERGRAIGTWTAAGALASAVGPPLAGWLVDTANWRMIFLLNVPLGAAALWATLRAVPESADGELPLDGPGAVIATVALGLITWVVSQASASGLGPASAVLLLAAVAGGMALWLHERRLGERAMIPPAMFVSPAFVGLNAYTLLLYAAFGGLFVLLPFALMTEAGYTASLAGAALLPLPIVLGVASGSAGRMSAAVGWRLPLAAGAGLVALGFALLAGLGAGSYWTEVLPGLSFIAIGMTGAVAPLTTAVLASVDDRHTGTAAGFNSAISRVGSMVAIAAASTVMGQGGTLSAFHVAAGIGAALSAAAALIALGLPGAKTSIDPTP